MLTMRHGEMLNDNDGLKSRGNDGPEGSIYTANLRSAQATGRYILSGNGIETYFRQALLSMDSVTWKSAQHNQ